MSGARSGVSPVSPIASHSGLDQRVAKAVRLDPGPCDEEPFDHDPYT